MNRKVPRRPVQSITRLIRLFYLSHYHTSKYKKLHDAGKHSNSPAIESALTVHNWGVDVIRNWETKIEVIGKPPEGAVLYTSNHLGYADIMGFASVVRTQYVAKKEIESWPFLGRMLSNINLPFVDRRQGAKTLPETAKRIANSLNEGASVCVFPEGTSTGGEDGVLEFKPALFQAAVIAKCKVQPVAIKWFVDDGDACVAEDVAYWKDHVFLNHALKFLGLKNVSLKVQFCDQLDGSKLNRKQLAAKAHAAVSEAFANL